MAFLRIVCLALLILLPAAALAGGAGIIVNTTADGADANPGDGVCDGDPVQGGNQCTLRAAIQQANAIGGADTITLGPGVHTLTLKRDPDLPDDQTGDLDVTSNVTIAGNGNDACDDPQSSCIDAKGGKDRAFDVSAGGRLELDDLVIRGGARRRRTTSTPRKWVR